MKWITDVLDHVAKFFFEFGKGLMLAAIGAYWLDKIGICGFIIIFILSSISVIFSFYLHYLFLLKKERKQNDV